MHILMSFFMPILVYVNMHVFVRVDPKHSRVSPAPGSHMCPLPAFDYVIIEALFRPVVQIMARSGCIRAKTSRGSDVIFNSGWNLARYCRCAFQAYSETERYIRIVMS